MDSQWSRVFSYILTLRNTYNFGNSLGLHSVRMNLEVETSDSDPSGYTFIIIDLKRKYKLILLGLRRRTKYSGIEKSKGCPR